MCAFYCPTPQASCKLLQITFYSSFKESAAALSATASAGAASAPAPAEVLLTTARDLKITFLRRHNQHAAPENAQLAAITRSTRAGSIEITTNISTTANMATKGTLPR